MLAIGGITGFVSIAMLDQTAFRRLRVEYGTAVLYWLVVAMTYVAFVSSIDNGGGTWAVNGMFSPLRWSVDNQLPLLFSEAMYDGTPRDAIKWGQGLASDRTPLLAALLLIVRSVIIGPLALNTGSTIVSTAYVLAGIVILSSW